MHLFQSPWLRTAAHSSRPSTRRVGTARRMAVLLQLEAARKPPLDLDLDPPPPAYVLPRAPEAEPVAA